MILLSCTGCCLRYILTYCSIGRKKIFRITSTLLCAVSFAVAWAPEFYSFCILEFLTGAADHGFYLTCVVLGSKYNLTNELMFYIF
ncbi:hypothetical protein KUTeg_006600 [Tegillarca granosa]|uniref:G-protein coupled receptors family 1 profile domain-containing protein n=1 Tax=Tegillarca granosa TaxID=220873 RepID=A0ABQ9FAT1_TEGGR|nr:hypothetical protein KUTeg_006600 [Tegillarca granosa]